MAHGDLLMEVQVLRSKVTILSSGGQVEGTSGWFGGTSAGSKEQVVRLEVLAINPRV